MKKVFTVVVLQFCFIYAFSQFRVVGYLPSWKNYPNSVNTVGLDKLTHLFVAFANPDVSGKIVMGSGTAGDLAVVVSAAHAKNVKVLVSIAGGSNSVPGQVYKDQIDNNLNGFTDNIVNFVVANNLDGIDVDIEGNVLNGNTLTVYEYEDFVTLLSKKMHAKGKILSAALAYWFANYVSTAAAGQFDFIGMMSYDAYGPWGGPGQHSPYSMTVNDFNYWTKIKGIPAAKLNVGLPFYAYCWGTYANTNGNAITYNFLVHKYAGAETSDQVGSGGDVIYYNGIATIKQKTAFALQNAGGVMIWELTQDATDARSLLLAVDQTVKAAKIKANTENSLFADDIKLYPNPFQEILHVKIPLTSMFDIEIYDLTGSLVIKETGMEPDAILHLQHLAPGLYTVKIMFGNRIEVRRVIKN